MEKNFESVLEEPVQMNRHLKFTARVNHHVYRARTGQTAHVCRELECSVKGKVGDSGLSVPLGAECRLVKLRWTAGHDLDLDMRAHWERTRGKEI